MKYFKNLELARVYHISEKSVRNWISSAKQGRLKLELYNHKGRDYIANTAKNQALIEELVIRGSKYKNTRSSKIATPKPELYNLYSRKQILDMVSNIGTYSELPFAYTYANGGAAYWDKYAYKLYNEKTLNTLNAAVTLLELNQAYLTHITQKYQHVNIIELGPGNCLPSKEVIAHFLKTKQLKRYIAIDLSKEMLDIAEENIQTWFKGEVLFERYIRDFNNERFEDLVAQDTFSDDNQSTVNLILMFGGTILNFRSPEHALQVINSSMGKHDIFIQCMKLDSVNSRRFFDLNIDDSSQHLLAPQERFLLDLLGIDESYYEVLQYFDEQQRMRQARIKLKVDLSIVFTELNKRVQLRKGESLLLWRVWHLKGHEAAAQLRRTNFDVLQLSKTNNQEYLLTTSKIKTEL